MGSAFENYMRGTAPIDPLSAVAFGHKVPDAEPETWARDYHSMSYPERAILRVFEYVKNRLEKTDNTPFEVADVYVVSFTYILGGWKAMVSTKLPDGMYYEVTYNSLKRETYLDAYKKFDNICLPDDEETP